MNHPDGLIDDQYQELQALAAKHDQKAKPRKDASLHMRISSSLLEESKEVALAEGIPSYQTWVTQLLENAVKLSLIVERD